MKHLPGRILFLVSGAALLVACEVAPSPAAGQEPGEVGAAQSAATACLCPEVMPGSEPFSVPDAVAPAQGQEGEFQCFGACGASCACSGKKEETITVDMGAFECTYHVTTCNTHSFCRWHDTCYKNCDEMIPGVEGDASATDRSACYRACDSSCFNGKPANVAWCPPELDPGPPPGSYGFGTCTSWALARNNAPSDGTIQFSSLLGTSYGDGICYISTSTGTGGDSSSGGTGGGGMGDGGSTGSGLGGGGGMGDGGSTGSGFTGSVFTDSGSTADGDTTGSDITIGDGDSTGSGITIVKSIAW